MPQETVLKIEQVTKAIQLYRQDTTTGDAEIQLFQNWNPPHATEKKEIAEQNTEKSVHQKGGEELVQEPAGA